MTKSQEVKGIKVSDFSDQKDLLEIVLTSVEETVTRYTRTPVRAGASTLQSRAEFGNIAVGGVIRFESVELSLELFLGFSKELFEVLYENMFQTPPDEISAANHDLAGEILNIAFGSIDPKFRQHDYRLVSSLPVVYSGTALADALQKMDAEAIVTPFSAGKMEFVLNIYSADSLQVQWKFAGRKHAGR